MSDEVDEMSAASRGYASSKESMVNHPLQILASEVNEASRAHATNYVGMLYALLEKGVITPEEIDAAREKAKRVVDEHFGPRPEATNAEDALATIKSLFGKA